MTPAELLSGGTAGPGVKGSLAMNVVSAVAAGTALVFFCYLALTTMAVGDTDFICNPEYTMYDDPEALQHCYETVIIPHNIQNYVTVVMFLFTLLEFVISIITSSFGCATVCRNAYSETMVVIYQKTAGEAPPALPVSHKEEP